MKQWQNLKTFFSSKFTCSINPFQPNVTFHIETIHLFCRAKKMTGFNMKHNTGLKWINYVTLVVLQMVKYTLIVVQDPLRDF